MKRLGTWFEIIYQGKSMIYKTKEMLYSQQAIYNYCKTYGIIITNRFSIITYWILPVPMLETMIGTWV